jgi:hypothetical protein
MKYRHFSPKQVEELHARSFIGYYFRSRWFAENGHLLWPRWWPFGLPVNVDETSSREEELIAPPTPPVPKRRSRDLVSELS